MVRKGRRDRRMLTKRSRRRRNLLQRFIVKRLKKCGKAYTARRKAASMLRKHNKEVRKTEQIRFYNKKYATFCRRLVAYVKKNVPEGSYFLHSPGRILKTFINVPIADETATRDAKPPALYATWYSKKDKSFLEWELKEFFFSSALMFLGMLILKDTAEFTHDVNYVREGEGAKPILVVTPNNLVAFSEKYVSIRKEGWHEENYYNRKWLMETFSGVSFEDYPQTFEEKAKYWSPKTKWYDGIDAVTIMVWSEDVVETLRDLGPIPKRCLYS